MIWGMIAMVYALVPMVVFGGLLYWAHYRAKNKYIRILLYVLGAVGAMVCFWYFIQASAIIAT